ncbi:hypothetical protein NB2BOR_A22410 [Bordetella parapertussis]|nr:hypothetical protein NB2BOR_A22410 [Bordetella parapertussis]
MPAELDAVEAFVGQLGRELGRDLVGQAHIATEDRHARQAHAHRVQRRGAFVRIAGDARDRQAAIAVRARHVAHSECRQDIAGQGPGLVLPAYLHGRPWRKLRQGPGDPSEFRLVVHPSGHGEHAATAVGRL